MKVMKKTLKYSNPRTRAEAQQAMMGGHTYLNLPRDAQLFRPRAGLMYIDILPYVAGKGNPWAEEGMLHWERTFYVHRGVGPNADTFICPRMTFKKPCPICEYRAKLIKEGDRGDPTVEDMIRDLAPKQRQIFNVIDVKEADKGVQIWDISYHLFGKLLDAMIRNSDEDEGWDRFFYLDEGYTLKIGFAEKSFGGATFFQAETIALRPRKVQYDEEILDQVYCLDDLLICPDYKELKRLFLQVEEEKKDTVPVPEPDFDEEEEVTDEDLSEAEDVPIEDGLEEDEEVDEATSPEEEEEEVEEEEEKEEIPPKKKTVKKGEEKPKKKEAKKSEGKEEKKSSSKKEEEKEEVEEEDDFDWDAEWEELEKEF